MSADNAIFILKFTHNNQTTYYVQDSFLSILENPEFLLKSKKINQLEHDKMIYKSFKNAKQFSDMKEAYNYAFTINNCIQTEYGVIEYELLM